MNEAADGEQKTAKPSVVASQDEGVVKTVEEMKKNKNERDDERASIYVATVRPAMIANKYRRIRLEAPPEQSVVGRTETNRGDSGRTGDEVHQPEREGNRDDDTRTPNGVDVQETGEDGRVPVDQNQCDSGEVETGEGALTERPGDDERAARRWHVTAERRHQRSLARREARRRRQNRSMTQQHAKRHKEEKLDHKAIERRIVR
ncbi:hypothetical protein DVH05_015140 [Phytophthora capsici]|nr:hypothetical protein DVH05_015140 [Phytophthora capsici]